MVFQLLLNCLFFAVAIKSETFHYYLEIEHKMKEDWSYANYEQVGTKIKCASLCYREQDKCFYFGYKEKNCHLMNSVNESECPEEECSEPEMKIYKLKKEVSPSTTESPTTIAIATEVDTTTVVPTITTTTASTTTIADVPATTIADVPTTTTTTTEDDSSTTTITISTTTDESTLPTTTTKPTTISTEEPTTISTTAAPTTSTTTSAPTSTTTTDIPTTTTAISTTSTEGTTTTKAPFSCHPPDGAEAEIKCPTSNFLLNGLGSKSPFFGDILSPKCYDFKQKMYDDSKESVYNFFSPDGGLSINAQCENEDDLIIRYKLCVMDAHIPAIIIHCSPIADTDKVEKVFNASSEEWKDGLVNCNDKTALQKIFMFDSGDAVITRVLFQCVLFDVPDNEVSEVVGDNPVG